MSKLESYAIQEYGVMQRPEGKCSLPRNYCGLNAEGLDKEPWVGERSTWIKLAVEVGKKQIKKSGHFGSDASPMIFADKHLAALLAS